VVRLPTTLYLYRVHTFAVAVPTTGCTRTARTFTHYHVLLLHMVRFHTRLRLHRILPLRYRYAFLRSAVYTVYARFMPGCWVHTGLPVTTRTTGLRQFIPAVPVVSTLRLPPATVAALPAPFAFTLRFYAVTPRTRRYGSAWLIPFVRLHFRTRTHTAGSRYRFSSYTDYGSYRYALRQYAAGLLVLRLVTHARTRICTRLRTLLVRSHLRLHLRWLHVCGYALPHVCHAAHCARCIQFTTLQRWLVPALLHLVVTTTPLVLRSHTALQYVGSTHTRCLRGLTPFWFLPFALLYVGLVAHTVLPTVTTVYARGWLHSPPWLFAHTPTTLPLFTTFACLQFIHWLLPTPFTFCTVYHYYAVGCISCSCQLV